MTSHRSIESVLASARQVLTFAQHGRDDFLAAGDRRVLGLHTAITHGRSVTFVVQNLRTLVGVEDFDSWYQPALDATFGRHRDVSAWAIELRNKIEKQGTVGELGYSLHIESFNTDDAGPPPPGATSMFIGDQLGRAGWDVVLPDGSHTQVFFRIPRSTLAMSMPEAPDGRPVEELLDVYLTDCADFIELARRRFGA